MSNEQQMGPHGSTPSDRLATSAASRNHRVYSCFYSWDAMYRQHKRMRVGTFLTLTVSRDRRARRAATARPPQPSPQLQLQFSARSLRAESNRGLEFVQ